MLKILANILEREDGAVTVDWVVLTAALVGFGTFIGLYLADPVRELDAKNGAAVANVVVHDIQTEFSASNP